MANVYFARSIRGDHHAADTFIFETITNAIKDCGHRVSYDDPALTAAHKKRLSEGYDSFEAFIHDRDIQWIDRAQAMIAEVSHPSLGVGYEIAYAHFQKKIPILVVALKDSDPISAMISGHFPVFWYRDSSDLTEWIKNFLSEGIPVQERY